MKLAGGEIILAAARFMEKLNFWNRRIFAGGENGSAGGESVFAGGEIFSPAARCVFLKFVALCKIFAGGGNLKSRNFIFFNPHSIPIIEIRPKLLQIMILPEIAL